MNRPLLLTSLLLVASVLWLGYALASRVDDVQIDAVSADALDRLPSNFPLYIARLHDRTPPTAPPTTAPKPKARSAPRVMGQGTPTVGEVNGYPCGGGLPPCRVLACESGGSPTARNPRSSASGLWQVIRSTWASFGGYPEAYMAPWEVQNEKARLLWAGGRGAFHWKACL